MSFNNQLLVIDNHDVTSSCLTLDAVFVCNLKLGMHKKAKLFCTFLYNDKLEKLFHSLYGDPVFDVEFAVKNEKPHVKYSGRFMLKKYLFEASAKEPDKISAVLHSYGAITREFIRDE